MSDDKQGIPVVFAPGSIHHGYQIAKLSKETAQAITIAKTADFIGWLFEHHIDHITEGEAWDEFNKLEEQKAAELWPERVIKHE